MLSDEEKKAIKEIRSFNQYNWELNNLKTKKFAKPYFDSLDTILNLIEKQSKEIEELKEDSCCMTNCVRRDKEKLFLEDKIKARIEKIQKRLKEETRTDFLIILKILENELQSLLEKE